MPELARHLPHLSAIMEEAGAIAQKARENISRRLKPDGSIVTNGDGLVEDFLRAKLTELVPGTSVWGEELGFQSEGDCGLWLVDPIDGTSNYAFGSPLWGVSIALLCKGSLELGGVFLPDLDERYLASKGGGVTLNGKRLADIPHGPISPEELVSYGDRILKLCLDVELPGKMRCAGAFVIDGCFVAVQRYRGLIGVREKLYDAAACMLFGQELDAQVSYADGSDLDLNSLARDVKIQKPWVIFPKDSGFKVEPDQAGAR